VKHENEITRVVGGYTARLATGEILLDNGQPAVFVLVSEARRVACDPARQAAWLALPGHSKGKAATRPVAPGHSKGKAATRPVAPGDGN